MGGLGVEERGVVWCGWAGVEWPERKSRRQRFPVSQHSFACSKASNTYRLLAHSLLPFSSILFLHTLLLLHNPRPHNPDLLNRPILPPRLNQAQSLHNSHPALHPSKNSMFPIQPWRRRQRNEKLASIRIRTTIRHTEHAGAGVFERRGDFVGEMAIAVVVEDGFAAAAGAAWIAGLEHEVGYYSTQEEEGD